MITRLRINYKGIEAVARSAEMEKAVRDIADDISEKLPIDSYTDSATGPERARAAVIARGKNAEETRDALLRALPGGGG